MTITKTQLTLLISLWFIIASCVGPRLTPTFTPTVVLPTATATTIPVTATSAPTLTPTPVVESRWECYQGGVACYDFLSDVSMLNAEEGWAVGNNGVVLHYTTFPNQIQPTWQQVYIPLSEKQPFGAIRVVGADEWWGINLASIVHYQSGEVQEFPTDFMALDLAVTGPDDVWVVGRDNSDYHGVVVHYQHGQIEEVPNPSDSQIEAIDMVSADEGWAVGSVGLLHYDNKVWELIDTPDEFNFRDVTAVADGDVWAVGSNIARYTAGQWEVTVDKIGGEGEFLQAISMVSPEEGWAVGDGGRIMRYQAGKWQEEVSPTRKQLMGIEMVSAAEGWAVGVDSTLLHYHNGIWELVSESVGLPPLQGSDIAWVDDVGWIVGGSSILRYQAGQWQQANSSVDNLKSNIDLTAIDMVSSQEGWVVGWEGVILHYTQGDWQLTSSPVTQNLYGLEMVNEQEGWAVGDQGVMIHYTKNNWHQIEPVTNQTLKAIDMVSESEGWVVGGGGTILHYQNGIWSKNELAEYQEFTQIDMIDETEGWILGTTVPGKIVILHFANNTWQPFDYPPEYRPTVLKMINAEEGWFVSWNGILHYQNGRWQIFGNPARDSMRSLVIINENEGWAVGYGLLHYTNQ